MEFDVWQYIWLTVHFGVPFFLMLLICIWAMSHFRWRVSRVKLWALSQAERARFGLSHWLPDLHGYEDRLKEWHQVAKTARGSNATSATCTGADEPMRNFALEYFARYRIPYVGLAVWMLVIAGPLLNLATWSALLIWRIRPVRIGVATAFIAVAFICLGFAIMNWRANSWQLNPIIRGAFYFGTACYFGATLVVVFNSADTSFFTLSVIFLTANFICVLELLAQSAATYLVDAEEFLGQQYCRDLVDGALSEFRRLNRGGADDVSDEGRTVRASDRGKKRAEQIEFEQSTKARLQALNDSRSTQIRQQFISAFYLFCMLTSKYVSLVTLVTFGVSSAWYGLSILILVAYTLVVHFLVSSRVAPYFLGWLVIAAVVLIDFCVYLYTRSGRPIHELTRLLLFAGVRVSLIAFTFEYWFMGHCLVFCICGIFFGYNIVDAYWPVVSSPTALNSKQFRFSQFAEEEDKDEIFEATIQEFAQHIGKSKLIEHHFPVCFPIILIIACFGALLGVSEEYSTSKVEFIGGAVSQYYVGIASLIIIFSLFCCFAAYRAYAVSSYSFSGKGFGVKRLLVFTQLELVGAAIGFWYLFASPILSTLTVFIPPLAFTIVALVRLQIATEFEFVQSPQFRNPPFSGFCSALCACGLPVEDFQHLFLVVWFCLLLLGMALSISLTYTPYIVGLAIPIYIAVVFNTFFPLLKYFYTLSWQWRDTLQVLSAVVLHFGFMVALYFYYADSAEQHVYIFGISGIYVPIAILLSAVLKAGVEGWRMSRYVSIVARVFLVVAIGVLVAAIIYFGWVVGAAILAGLVFLSVSAYMINAWIDQHYVFSTLLSVLAWILFSICILCGVGIGIQVSPFWGFTGSWYTIIAALLVWALGLYRQGAISSSGAPNPTPLLFSPSVFPVYRFAVNSNDVTASNAPVFLLYICMLLVLLWSVAAAVVEPAVGLGISALCITLAFVYTRWAQRAQASLFSETIAYLRFDLVEATRRRAIDLQMSANTQMLHALQLDGAVVDERGQSIVVNYASIVAREHRLLDSLQLTSLFPTHAAVDYSVLEYAVQQIDLMDRQRDALFEIEQQFIAHFVFLLVLATRASVVEDEARFARFRQWLSVNKPQWELDDHLTVDATLEWTDDECAVYRELKSEFEAFEARESAENARRRAEEEAALQARQEALQRKLRDQMSVDEAQKLFAEINEQCRQQSTMWSDDAFPASDVSLYIGGSRRFDTQSTIHMVNVSRWLRPCEYCDADLPPVLCEPDRGYDIFQLQQGSIGDCYLISAIGVCALRKDESSTTNVTSSTAPDGDVSGSGSAVAAQPEFVENQTMRALISPAVYNPNGIYLVRFFKQGKEIPVLIDDRLPCWAAAGLETEPGRTQCADSPCFVRSRSIGEIWPSLIEKAYAKLHGSYEVIEAGKVHHALVDITNGASDEIRIDSAEVRANIDSFWERLSTFHRAGYLLACGSNAGRDTHDDGGIFMGHAYAILRLYCEDDLRLIELRNPWGRGEWRGDWSDKSPLWTKRLRTVLNVSDVDDGVFWMSFPDFMQKFANIFVCRLMRRPPVMVSGRWQCLNQSDPMTAAGAKHPFNNPHYLLTVSRPQTVYIVLQQSDVRSATKTTAQQLASLRSEERRWNREHAIDQDSDSDSSSDTDSDDGESNSAARAKFRYIMFYVFDNEGKRVEDIVQAKPSMLIAANRSRFLNDREVSAEVELPHANSPFTILCTTRDAREETSFTLSVFSHDEISLKAMPAPSEAFARSVLALERSEKLKDEQDRADLEAALERRKKRLQQSNQVDA